MLIVRNDRCKLFMNMLLYMVLSLLLVLLTLYTYLEKQFLGAFLGGTVAWLCVKNLYRYGGNFICNIPICECSKDQITVHKSITKKTTFDYKHVQKVKLYRERSVLKLFICAEQVEHPSGWQYVRIYYVFKQHEIEKIEHDIKEYLTNRKVSVIS